MDDQKRGFNDHETETEGEEEDGFKPKVKFRIRAAADAVIMQRAMSLGVPLPPEPGSRRGGGSLGGGGLLPPPPGSGARGAPSRSPGACGSEAPMPHPTRAPMLQPTMAGLLQPTPAAPMLHTAAAPMLQPTRAAAHPLSQPGTPPAWNPPPTPHPSLVTAASSPCLCHSGGRTHPAACHFVNGPLSASMPACPSAASSPTVASVSAAPFQLQVLERYTARFIGKARHSASAHGEVRVVPRSPGATLAPASFRLTLANAERVGPLQENGEVVRREGAAGGGGERVRVDLPAGVAAPVRLFAYVVPDLRDIALKIVPDWKVRAWLAWGAGRGEGATGRWGVAGGERRRFCLACGGGGCSVCPAVTPADYPLTTYPCPHPPPAGERVGRHADPIGGAQPAAQGRPGRRHHDGHHPRCPSHRLSTGPRQGLARRAVGAAQQAAALAARHHAPRAARTLRRDLPRRPLWLRPGPALSQRPLLLPRLHADHVRAKARHSRRRRHRPGGRPEIPE